MHERGRHLEQVRGAVHLTLALALDLDLTLALT